MFRAAHLTTAQHRPIGKGLALVALTVMAWRARRKDRTSLSRLDPHLLRDIGLDEGTVAVECAKPFWRR